MSRPLSPAPLARPLRQALRSLARTPALVAAAVLSLALGIGANTAVFSLIQNLLFADLPYAEPDRLVRIWETFAFPDGRGEGSVSIANLRDWQQQATALSAIGGYQWASFNWLADSGASRLLGVETTPEVWSILGATPELGRTYTNDDVAKGERVVVLAHSFWERQLASDPAILGKAMVLNGGSAVVIGVMPRGFTFPPRSEAKLWAPFAWTERDLANRGNHSLATVARLAPGASLEQARQNLEAVARRLELLYPDQQQDRSVLLRALPEAVSSRYRAMLFTLWAAVSAVLLIGCANVANLLLVRATGRRRDLALCAALGASRWRLILETLTESLLLALAGGVLGVVLGVVAVEALATLPGSGVAVSGRLGLNLPVLSGSLAVATLAALLAGVAPALRASRVALHQVLAEGSPRSGGVRRDPLRTAMVIAEVALALIVTVGASLMLRSLGLLAAVAPGMRSAGVMTMHIALPEALYATPEAQLELWERLSAEVRRLPGVEGAGLIDLLPLQSWGFNGDFTIAGQGDLPPGKQPFAEFRTVSDGYFDALAIPLLAGRGFEAGDRGEEGIVVLVNRALVERFLPGVDPLGARFGFGDTWATVVGVVGDVRGSGLDAPVRPEIYFTERQRPRGEMSLVVATAGQPTAIVEPVRAALARLDRTLPLDQVLTMEEVVRSFLAGRRFSALLLGLFALLALLLAAIGLYGVISYSVAQRTFEIGVRMALGADRRAALGVAFRHGLALVLAGVGSGVPLALALGRLVASQLYLVTPSDPLAYGRAAAVLLAVGSVACLIPASQAMRVSPVRALGRD